MSPAGSLAATSATEQAINYEPSIAFVDVTAGNVALTSITVRNQTLVDTRFEVAAQDMREEPGAGRALEPVPIGDAARGAGAWLRPSTTSFVLAAGTERQVTVVIDVPADAGAGGHYAAVVFTARPVEAQAQFQFDAVTSVAMLLTVAGDYQRDLRVSITPDARVRWSGGPVGWTVHLRNDGDVHEVVAGRVTVDATIAGAKSMPLRSGILLPGESRTEHATFQARSAPDLLRATVKVTREDAKPIDADAASTWIVPWWIAVVIALIVALVLRRRALRRRDAG